MTTTVKSAMNTRYGNTDENGCWGNAMAVGEMRIGEGSVVVSQLKLAGRVLENPVAWNFAKRMLLR